MVRGPAARAGDRDSAQANRYREALGIVHTLSVEMLGDTPTEMMLWGLLEQIYAFLKPGRGVVLLKDLLDDFTNVPAKCQAIKDVEHRADDITHRAFERNRLLRRAQNPVDLGGGNLPALLDFRGQGGSGGFGFQNGVHIFSREIAHFEGQFIRIRLAAILLNQLALDAQNPRD